MASDCLFRATRLDNDESGLLNSVLHPLSNQGIVFDNKSTPAFSPRDGEATR